MFESLRSWARRIKYDTVALYFAARHPRTPLIAKIIAGAVVAYALSPIDLIPDFIPILGYLDDVIVVPFGIWIALRYVPPDVMAECRLRAHDVERPRSYWGAAMVVAVWLAVAVLLAIWAHKHWQ